MTTENAFELIPLEDLRQFDLPNGMPCFIGDVDNICEHIEAHGYNFYYLISNEQYSFVDNKVTKTGTRPTILKVVSTIVSRSVTVADPDELMLDTNKVEATYSLPKIPFEYVQMMDDFFRAVEDKHGTESILLLTYNPNFLESENPSAGWGILVPEQVNTAADCYYDHESVAQYKDEEAYIVGSAHSHPGMAAFASGTDHKDQADFPGIHITYGWRKSVNNNATEYHIELQTPGCVFSMQPEQVFESSPKSDPSPLIDEWMEKVSKKQPVHTTGPGTFGNYNSGLSYGSYSSTNSYGQSSTSTFKAKDIKLPAGFPDHVANVIVAELLDDKEQNCPCCQTKFIRPDIDKRRCLSCHTFITLPGESVDDIVKHRNMQSLFSPDIDIDKNPSKNIYVWSRTPTEKVELYYSATSNGGEPGKA